MAPQKRRASAHFFNSFMASSVAEVPLSVFAFFVESFDLLDVARLAAPLASWFLLSSRYSSFCFVSSKSWKTFNCSRSSAFVAASALLCRLTSRCAAA